MKLKTVWFTGVILGKIYVAVEFINGLIRHYWLQEPPAWKPGTIYPLGALVQPTIANGYYYEAPTSSPIPVWESGKVYAAGAKVQPTTANGFYYLLSDVTGDSPTSGDTEPLWPTTEGAQVFEGTDSTDVPSVATTPSSSPTTGISDEIAARYGLDDPS